MKGNEKKDP